MIELHWGDPKHPRVAIVGKGVCFDSGGLDIKPAAGMLLMKKDMGGAAVMLTFVEWDVIETAGQRVFDRPPVLAEHKAVIVLDHGNDASHEW